MKLPDYLEENNRLVKKYLYPIMYEDKDNNVKLIYVDELNDLKKKLDSNIIEILEKAIERRKIAVVDSTLTKEEQLEFIKEFVQQNEKQQQNNEVTETSEEFENFFKDNSINVSPVDIANYLSSDIKNKVNIAMQLEMPYIIEKLYINDDITKIMVILDTIMNNKTKVLLGMVIDDNIKNSLIMGMPLKNIASYYKCNILGAINDDIEIDTFIENLEEIIKSTSNVSKEEAMDYTMSEIVEVRKQQEGNKKRQ